MTKKLCTASWLLLALLQEISCEFYDKLFNMSLQTEEASASSASVLATPLVVGGELAILPRKIAGERRMSQEVTISLPWLLG